MAAPIVEPGVYYIQNAATGTVVDLSGGHSTDGTKVQGWQKHELDDAWVPAQLWVISRVGNQNIHTIQNTNSRTFMEMKGDNISADRHRVTCSASSGTDNQKWVITRTTNKNAYVIANVASGTYADLLDGNKANATEINGYQGLGGGTENPHQLWLIVRA